ncbi:MAG TPA: TonB-dependent receptor plug domain-containing protein, partial [Flavitalea sp.]|nr:TonB-dependent receptor plug domain-containing protein [Flavitalea sp.]
MRKIKILLIATGLISGGISYAQQSRIVTGIVKDSTGTPLSGVSFQIKGSRVAGFTDQNGNFRLTVAQSNPVLEFTSIGYKRTELPVTGNNMVSVILDREASEMSEVVVTGFGIKQQSRKLAYSVQEIKGDALARANTSNMVNALQGKVAGVMINQGAGGPSSSSRIRIRGNASISKNNTQPLFVVDGVLIKPGVSGADSWGDNRDFGNELKNLNADDYESVTVLKGSAATALYGSDALFGVVLITTKKGKSRKGLGVNFTQSASFEKAYKLPDFQNEYGGGYDPFFVTGADGMREVEGSNGPYYSFGPRFDGQPFRDAGGRIIPWQANDILSIYRTGAYYNTNVAVEGGSDRTTVRFSYTTSRNNSVLPNNNFKRDVFTLRATQKLNSFVNLDASATYVTSNSKNPMIQGGNTSPLFRLAYSNARQYDIPYYMTHYLDTARGGMVGADGNPTNDPYARASMNSLWWNIFENAYTQKEDNLRANLDLNVNVLPWLNLLVRGNVNSNVVNKEDKVRGQGPGFLGSSGSYTSYQSNFKTGRLQALLNASKNFGEDIEASLSAGGETFRGLGGFEAQSNTVNGLKIADLFVLSNSVDPINVNTDRSRKFPVARQDAVYA